MERRTKVALGALGLTLVAAASITAQDAPQKADIVIASTTDVHGRVRAWDYFADTIDAMRGLSRAATVIDSARKANSGGLILVDAGDFLQGTPFTYAAARIDTLEPNAVVAAMNAMRYDAVTIGNHEFNYGVPALQRALSTATFVPLGANITGGPKSVPWRAFTIVERCGAKVGIIGATTPGSMVWDATNLKAAGVRVGAIEPAVRTAVADARAAGADVIIVVAHAGLSETSNYDTLVTGVSAESPMAGVARDVPGIDLIVFGHTHREVADTVINGVLLTQPLNWAASVSFAHVLLEKSGGKWRIARKYASVVKTAHHPESEAIVRAAERGHESARKFAATVIGRTRVTWTSDSARFVDSPITDFVSETMRRTYGADLASSSVFSTDARLAAGPVTMAELSRLYPYENTTTVVRISGATLKEFLEQSAKYFRVTQSGAGASVSPDPKIWGYNYEALTGADYAIDLNRPIGDRITGLTYRGKPVRATDSFTLAISNYRASGAGGYTMLAGAPVVVDMQEDVRQALADEVTRRGTLNPADYHTPNWRVIFPAAAPSRSVAAKPAMLRIISTNDFHGALEARPDGNFGMRGGAAQFAAMIKKAEAECSGGCASILLDAGDEFQGTPASNLAYGKPVTDLFNALGLTASAIGNHDFDWGTDTLRARMRQAHYAMLAANVHFADGRDVPWIRGDTIVDRGGLQVGVIGIASPLTPSNTKSSNIAGLRFDDPIATVDAHAKSLRARGAGLVIVVEHDGAFCNRNEPCSGEIIRVAKGLTERVDAIVSGHTHSIVNTTVNGIPVIQALSSGRAIGVIDLPVAVADRARESASVRMVNTDSITPDPAIAAMMGSATQSVASLVSRPIATAPADMPRSGEQYALGNLIADSQRAAAHSDVAIMNNGGIRADVHAGPLSYGALFEVEPFSNLLVTLTVPGSALRTYLESFFARGGPRIHLSGAVVHYDMQRPPGSRLTSIVVGGAPLDDAKSYTLAFTDFMQTGGEGVALTKTATKLEPLTTDDLDALIAFVRAMPGAVIKADAAPRVIPVPP